MKSAPKMPTRPLGKMGWDVSIYAVGTAELPAGEGSVQTLRELMDAGVNYIDTAPSYQRTRSETLIGQAVAGRRDQVWIATKTLERAADAAYKEINESLKRLGIDAIDLLQVHAVNANGTLDAVLRKGGAIEGIERAKSEGLIRHIGITGHTRPEVILRAIKEYPFESILVPTSALDRHVNDFADEVIPTARKKGLAVVGMKSVKGIERATKGEFEPAEFIRYSMSLPISTLTIGLRKIPKPAENLKLALAFKEMTRSEMRALEQEVERHSNMTTLWWKKQ